jgi:quercetin dioxygenase-like cupin family protein
MRRNLISTTVVVLAIAILGAGGSFLRADAQDATAPIPSNWGVPGFETLSDLHDPSLAPGMVLELGRLTWEPGFTIAMHTHPNANDAAYVLSGSVAWSIDKGTAEVTRATVAGTPGPVEILQPGGEVVLEAGDAITFAYPRIDQMHAARVVGDEPVVMLIATIYDPSKPFTVFPEDAGTPTS